jgi:DNA-binding NtrC family response regulator
MGRSSECDLILFDRSASRNHAEITKIDDNFFIVDLNSTNGTLVNDLPITLQTRLKSFDCIKIGQEIFIFDPYLDIITGQAPAALILNAVNESHQNLISRPAVEAAASVTAEQAAAAAGFSSALCLAPASEVNKIIVNFLIESAGATSVSIIWPGGSGGQAMSSYLSYPEDKRLLLSHVPFKRITEIGQALIWPRIITELDFNSGSRHVGQLDQNCLLVPVYGSDPQKPGLLYLENSAGSLGEPELNLAALAAQIFSPFLVNAVAQAELDKEKIQAQVSEDLVSDIATRDSQVRIVFSTAAHVAQTEDTVFLTGEVGTDKTSLAKYIHTQSLRKNGRLVIVTLSDMPPAQMDRLLFGQEDAQDTHLGLLALADSGTIFLRHIEFLTTNAQRGILMALEEGLIYPVGSRLSRTISVRFITSSSTKLHEKVEAGLFREDLYARLTRINLYLPPLRETKNDIDALVSNFLVRSSRHLGLPFQSIDPSALECLRAYPWPGNIAELRNECAILANFTKNGRVTMDTLPPHLRLAVEAFAQTETDPESLLGEAERYLLMKTLACQAGDIELAGLVLNITPEDVIMKSRAYGLDPLDFQSLSPSLPLRPGPVPLPADEPMVPA